MKPIPLSICRLTTVATCLLGACASPPQVSDGSGSRSAAGTDASLKREIQTVVVIFAENRGFDTLYGLFPGADGIPGVNPSARGTYVPQTDRGASGAVLAKLPQTWGGVTVAGQPVTLAQGATAGQDNRPFQIDAESGYQGSGVKIGQDLITRDLYHRFYENQMQINDGRNDKFAAYADGGGLSMGYYDGSQMRMWQLARQYVLADQFFMGAFGGSYLNHQYLICACVPTYPDAENSPAKDSISVVDRKPDGSWSAHLSERKESPVSSLDGAPHYIKSSNLTPANYAGDQRYYSVNTMQPAYQPSGVAPADGKSDLLADMSKPSALPAQTQATIGDMLDRKGVDWAWYGGAWNAASEEGRKPANVKRQVIYSQPVGFQTHHQPFNYYATFDPLQPATAAYRAAHLRDFDSRFLQEAAAGRLPPVTFYKPQGNLNQHAGYANVKAGDEHIAEVIGKLQQSPQWKNMLIVVTYDENGGFWDHVAPPKGDIWGPGTRIPAIIVSPWAKRGVVDHTPYDTASILRFITRRWNLETLPGIRMRDEGLAKNGSPPMGDLTQALDFSQAPR